MKENEEESGKRNKFWIPLLLALCLVGGMLIGRNWDDQTKGPGRLFEKRMDPFGLVLKYIDDRYVDTVDHESLYETGIKTVLDELDPYSDYIPSRYLKEVSESLRGNFEGIGIEFSWIRDTVMVLRILEGGPSEQVDLLAGDMLVEVDSEAIASQGLNNEDVIKRLKGESGTEVNIRVYRREKGFFDVSIERGKIEVNSVDAYFMLDDNTGYIKVNKFSGNTIEEFGSALKELNNLGLKKLVLDLRGNPGGYLDAAVKMADEFLSENKLITYTKGRKEDKNEYSSTDYGYFEKGPLAVLIDEGSASASEIVSGALQDQDRAFIVGRRSFGKGLVQEQYRLPNGAALRLTVSRYYTPSGRCIQKSYGEGGHDEEVNERVRNGELFHEDSIHVDESERFTTKSGRSVYGGGGIVPDNFVAADSIDNTRCLNAYYSKGFNSELPIRFINKFKNNLQRYANPRAYSQNFKFNSKETAWIKKQMNAHNPLLVEDDCHTNDSDISNDLRARIGRVMFGNEAFYRIRLAEDETLMEASELLKEKDNKFTYLGK